MARGLFRLLTRVAIVRSLGSVTLLLTNGGLATMVGNACAQPPGFAVEVLLRAAPSDDETKQVVVARGELAPGATTGRHTHPGDEFATVLEGELELRLDDGASRRVHAGEAYHNPRGIAHETRNVGEGPLRVLSTFVIDKGRPLTEPVATSTASPGR